MVKAKAKVEKQVNVKSPRRAAITAEEFLKVYVPAARAGKSASEIGALLGRDAQFVTVKASQLRHKLRESETKVELPKLRGGAGRKNDTAELAEMVKGLLTAMDAETPME